MSGRLAWGAMFFDVGMTPSEAEELQATIDLAWFGDDSGPYEAWVVHFIKESGRAHFEDLAFAMQLMSTSSGAFTRSRQPALPEVTRSRLRRALDDLIAKRRVTRCDGETYVLVNILETLAEVAATDDRSGLVCEDPRNP